MSVPESPASSTDRAPERSLARARRALDQGRWLEARAEFVEVVDELDDTTPLAAEAWDGIGLASYWLDDAEAAVDAHERAFRLYRTAGQPVRSARAAIWLTDHYLTFHGAPAVARGWLERAGSLLEGLDPDPVHAWLEIYRGHYALMVERDARAALAHGSRGLELARETGAADAEMVARSMEGLALVSTGAVREGMPRLDEASAAAVSRELTDLNAAAWACCYLIHGCESVRDFQRAGEWCERVKRFCERWGLKPIFGSCRTHYASVLTWRGQWPEAERELQETMADAQASRPPIVRATQARLAELRWRQGDVEAAEVLLAGAAGHPMALLVQGTIALEAGRGGEALDLARRFLRNVPPQSRTERVDGLALLAQAAWHQGDFRAAAEAADEVESIAVAVDTPLLWAAAYLARAARAGGIGDRAGVRAALEDSAHLFAQGGAPFEAARVRVQLAEHLASDGEVGLARRELGAAARAFKDLGAEPRERAAVERMAQLDAPTADATPSTLLTDRELDVLRRVAEGLTNAQIAEVLYLSPHTVKRHVANILTKLGEATRAAAVARGTREGWI